MYDVIPERRLWRHIFINMQKLIRVISISGFNKPSEADPRLQVPLFDIIFPFLPEKILKPLRFGVPYDKVCPGIDTASLLLSFTGGNGNKIRCTYECFYLFSNFVCVRVCKSQMKCVFFVDSPCYAPLSVALSRIFRHRHLFQSKIYSSIYFKNLKLSSNTVV